MPVHKNKAHASFLSSIDANSHNLSTVESQISPLEPPETAIFVTGSYQLLSSYTHSAKERRRQVIHNWPNLRCDMVVGDNGHDHICRICRPALVVTIQSRTWWLRYCIERNSHLAWRARGRKHASDQITSTLAKASATHDKNRLACIFCRQSRIRMLYFAMAAHRSHLRVANHCRSAAVTSYCI